MRSIALICTHNGKNFIAEQINSILAQTVQLSRIYVHDYNSSDGTQSVIEELIQDNPIFDFEKFDFAFGPAHSFLSSILKINGKENSDFLLYLVDQDDVWDLNKNEIILHEFSLRQFDVAFHDVKIVDENLNLISDSYYGNFWNVERDLKFPNQFYSNCVIGHTCVFTSGFLRAAELNYDFRIPMHDWYLINQALLINSRVSFINLSLSFYRQHGANILGASRGNRKSILKSINNYSALLFRYHNFLEERFPGFMKSKKINSPLTVLFHIRPLKKTITILFIKFIFRNDKI